MKKLSRLKLNNLSDRQLEKIEMNELKGGNSDRFCTCSCFWAEYGGSSSSDNMNANYKVGPYGGYSPEGGNNYWKDDEEYGESWPCKTPRFFE